MIQATDSELLMRFALSRDQDAFRVLVERHGRLVRSVCRRVLRDEGDIEDAAQAAFLVLARDAATIRCRSSLAGWLFQVAHRAAIRAAVARQQRKEQPLESEPDSSSDVLADLQQRETFELLAAELSRLPEHYRAPLVLLYMEGRSHRDAAEELECSDTVLKGRAARARHLLRQRLARRGIGLSVVFGAWAVTADPISAATVQQTLQAALEYSATGQAGPACSTHSVSLAEGIQPMTSLALTKSTVALGSIVLAGLLTAAGVGAHQASAQANMNSDSSNLAALIESEADLPASRTADETQLLLSEPGGDAVQARSDEFESLLEPVDLKKRSPAVRKIEEALVDPRGVAIEFVDTPLREAMGFFGATFNIPIVLESLSLSEQGISPDEPIDQVISGALPLERALNVILGPRGLTYLIEDDVLKITTKKAAQARRETRVYPIVLLVDAGFDAELLPQIFEEHARTVGEEAAIVQPLGRFLVITQSPLGHRRTLDLLEQLHRAANLYDM